MSGSDRDGDSTLGGLLMQIAGGALRIVQGEIALRSAEAREIAVIVLRALIVIVVAVVLVILGLGQLTDAAHQGLVRAGLSPLWSSVVTGLVLCLVALGLILWQLSRIRRARYLARRQIFAESDGAGRWPVAAPAPATSEKERDDE